MPFEVREMRATSDGFELAFTKPVDATQATDPAAYSIESYTYLLHETYGSDEVDKQTLTDTDAPLGTDDLSVRLTIDGLREGYVHELRATLTSRAGEPLLHPAAYYTLIERP
jgi:hypothetical protein